MSFNTPPPSPGTIPIQHVASGTGLQSISVVGGMSVLPPGTFVVDNATVTIPAFLPGTREPTSVNVTFTVNTPGLPVDFTIEARSRFHGISIRVQCACTRTVTITDDPSLFPGGPSAVSVAITESATGGTITVSPGPIIGTLPLTGFSVVANIGGNVTFTGLPSPSMFGSFFPSLTTTYSIVNPGLPVDFTLSARDPFHGVRIRVRCAALP